MPDSEVLFCSPVDVAADVSDAEVTGAAAL